MSYELDGNLSVDGLQEAYAAGQLGEFKVEDIPVLLSEEEQIYGQGQVRMDLDQFYEAITSDDSELETPDLEQISSVCLLGSVLYENNDKDEMPSDLDLLLLRENTGDEQDIAVVPEQRSEAKFRRLLYSVDEVEEAIVHTQEPVLNSFFYRAVLNYPDYQLQKSAIDLNLQQRSERQFKEGVGRGDTVSESVYNHGVPLIGQEKFEQLVTELKEEREDLTVNREQLHDLNWYWDENDLLQAKLIVPGEG